MSYITVSSSFGESLLRAPCQAFVPSAYPVGAALFRSPLLTSLNLTPFNRGSRRPKHFLFVASLPHMIRSRAKVPRTSCTHRPKRMAELPRMPRGRLASGASCHCRGGGAASEGEEHDPVPLCPSCPRAVGEGNASVASCPPSGASTVPCRIIASPALPSLALRSPRPLHTIDAPSYRSSRIVAPCRRSFVL